MRHRVASARRNAIESPPRRSRAARPPAERAARRLAQANDDIRVRSLSRLSARFETLVLEAARAALHRGVDERDHRRNFDQRTDDGGEGGVKRRSAAHGMRIRRRRNPRLGRVRPPFAGDRIAEVENASLGKAAS
jgi:hypothetical protein